MMCQICCPGCLFLNHVALEFCAALWADYAWPDSYDLWGPTFTTIHYL